MEQAFQKLELLIQHLGVDEKIVTQAFLAACGDYAKDHGFNLLKDCMVIHRALLPSNVKFDEDKEHIIITDGNCHPFDHVVFFRDSFKN